MLFAVSILIMRTFSLPSLFCLANAFSSQKTPLGYHLRPEAFPFHVLCAPSIEAVTYHSLFPQCTAPTPHLPGAL